MDINQIFSFIYDLSLVVILIPPTIFVFGVTLLGAAIDKSLQEERLAKENEGKEIAQQLKDLEKVLEGVRKGGDMDEIYKQIQILKKNRNKTDKKINQISKKYQSINIANTILKPSAAFVLVAFLSHHPDSLIGLHGNDSFYLLTLILLIFIYGVFKIHLALSLIQEISSNKKENEYFDSISQAFKDALSEYYQGIKEEASLSFTDKVFPLNINTLTELDLKFKVKLDKGRVLKEVNIWFFIPDGFELIDPLETESWRQSADYRTPNIRTVPIKIGDLSVGPVVPKKIKIKTPSNTGKYIISYKIYAEGYVSTARDITLFVE